MRLHFILEAMACSVTKTVNRLIQRVNHSG